MLTVQESAPCPAWEVPRTRHQFSISDGSHYFSPYQAKFLAWCRIQPSPPHLYIGQYRMKRRLWARYTRDYGAVPDYQVWGVIQAELRRRLASVAPRACGASRTSWAKKGGSLRAAVRAVLGLEEKSEEKLLVIEEREDDQETVTMYAAPEEQRLEYLDNLDALDDQATGSVTQTPYCEGREERKQAEKRLEVEEARQTKQTKLKTEEGGQQQSLEQSEAVSGHLLPSSVGLACMLAVGGRGEWRRRGGSGLGRMRTGEGNRRKASVVEGEEEKEMARKFDLEASKKDYTGLNQEEQEARGALRVGKVEEQVERDLCEVGTKKSAYESSEGEQEPGGSGTRETAGQCSGGQILSLQRG